jgi:hypothetical protein
VLYLRLRVRRVCVLLSNMCLLWFIVRGIVRGVLRHVAELVGSRRSYLRGAGDPGMG